jgi:hypothetical protein
VARGLSARDWLALGEAWLELARARVIVARRPSSDWRARVAPPPGRADYAAGARVARLVGLAAAAQPGQARCLARALAQRALLRRRGVRATIRFGVRRVGIESPQIEGHAWVEVAGRALEPDTGPRARYLELRCEREARRG